MNQWLALALGALGGFGLVLAWSGWVTPPAPREPYKQLDGFVLVRLAAGALAAAATGLYTGWVVGTIAAGIAGFYAAGLARGGRRTTQHELAKIEAVATWAEMLRDTLAAGQGLAETIQSTADIAPAEIRPSIRSLAVRIERERLSLALREWADEVDDPSADLVATVLIVAATRAARDVGELLTALASTARERANMQMRVDAQRASIRSEVRSIIVISLLFLVVLTVVARSFLEPYATAEGQLMLLFVVGIFGGGLWWLSRLSRFRRPARFLARERDMTQALIVGAVLGLGLWLMVAALAPARVPLAMASRRLQREGRFADLDAEQDESVVLRLGRWLLPSLGEHRVVRPTTVRDLAVVGRSVEEHVGRKCLSALVGLVYIPAGVVALQLGGVSVPIVLPAWLALATAALGWFLPDLLLTTEAKERRRAFRHALGAFVDVMVMLLAANEGIEGALHLAADAGDGWAFTELRRALREAQVQGETPWRALSELGQQLGIDDLVELAATAALAGSEGASVRRSLVTKAASIRAHAASEEEAEAQAASARMTLPMLVMLIGFVLFIGYPAMTLVLEA